MIEYILDRRRRDVGHPFISVDLRVMIVDAINILRILFV